MKPLLTPVLRTFLSVRVLSRKRAECDLETDYFRTMHGQNNAEFTQALTFAPTTLPHKCLIIIAGWHAEMVSGRRKGEIGTRSFLSIRYWSAWLLSSTRREGDELVHNQLKE